MSEEEVAMEVEEVEETRGCGSCAREGDWAVWDVNGEKSSFVQVKAAGQVRLGKFTVSAEPLVGAMFGSQFQLDRTEHALELLVGKSLLDETTRELNTDKNNADLIDDEANQGLTASDIAALKSEAKDGKELVDALCSNSKSFESKTVFSQEKYVKRKAKKYMAVATLRRPTAAAVAECYFGKMPLKVCGLRPDTLAVMLNMANVGPHQQVLVVETCAGVVTAAVAERLGGLGTCCSAFAGSRPASIDAVRFCNFSRKTRRAVFSCSLSSLEAAFASQRPETETDDKEEPKAEGEEEQKSGATKKEIVQEAEEQGMEVAAECKAEVTESVKQVECQGGEQAVAGDETGGEEGQVGNEEGGENAREAPRGDNKDKPQRPRGVSNQDTPSNELMQQWGASGFTGCILAAPALHPVEAMKHLMPLLAPSAPFVIFSGSLQPLTVAMEHLQRSREAVMLSLIESWHREYQVLPARTHPTMSTSGTGGYLLSGIKVLNPPRPAGLEPKPRQSNKRQRW